MKYWRKANNQPSSFAHSCSLWMLDIYPLVYGAMVKCVKNSLEMFTSFLMPQYQCAEHKIISWLLSIPHETYFVCESVRKFSRKIYHLWKWMYQALVEALCHRLYFFIPRSKTTWHCTCGIAQQETNISIETRFNFGFAKNEFKIEMYPLPMEPFRYIDFRAKKKLMPVTETWWITFI